MLYITPYSFFISHLEVCTFWLPLPVSDIAPGKTRPEIKPIGDLCEINHHFDTLANVQDLTVFDHLWQVRLSSCANCFANEMKN